MSDNYQNVNEPRGRHRLDDEATSAPAAETGSRVASAGQDSNGGAVPLRGLAMVLIFIGVILAAWGVYVLTTGDEGEPVAQQTSSSAAPGTPATPTNPAAPSPHPEPESDAPNPGAVDPGATPAEEAALFTPATMHVQVLNNGLAPNRAEEVATDLNNQGWSRTDHGNLPEAQYRAQANSVFYRPGNDAEKAAAERAADNLGSDWVVAELPAELADQPPGIVVVII